MKPYLTIVIPAYNEEHRIEKTLVSVRSFVRSFGNLVEVLVVDDGSHDNTVKVVRSFQDEFPELSLLVQTNNQGKGAAVARGILSGKGEVLLFMDADSSTEVTELTKLLPYIKEYPVVIGSRYLDEKSIKVRQPFKRRIISRTCNRVIQLLLLPGVVDTQCGFKLFTESAAQSVFKDLQVKGWSFNVELLTKARISGLRIKEVAVDWYNADLSTLRARSGAVQFIRDVWFLWRTYGLKASASNQNK